MPKFKLPKLHKRAYRPIANRIKKESECERQKRSFGDAFKSILKKSTNFAKAKFQRKAKSTKTVEFNPVVRVVEVRSLREFNSRDYEEKQHGCAGCSVF